MKHVNEIEGIGPSHAEKLESHGIRTVEDLLKSGATPNGREELVKKTGISHHLILKWVDEADLFRVKDGKVFGLLVEPRVHVLPS